ncbi:MAG: RluA family pseudouridine synthase [Candidatus Omnitrophica bacterium]|nr:RluA family pseudouridine synthase [Candidatus Omnitrophota bacterium]
MAEEEISLKVNLEDKGKRMDKFLVEKLPKTFSRTFLQKLIAGGHVLLDGESAKSHFKMKAGQSIEITIPEQKVSLISAEDIPIDIVYEDEDLLVVNKPSGLVVHPAPGNYSGTLVNALLGYCKNLSGEGGAFRPGIVHRIDKDVSGLLVVAKNDRAHRSLSKQFKAKAASRVYIALVKGVVQLDNDIIELPIGRSPRDWKKMAVNFVDSREAITRYKVLKRFEDFTVMEVTLGTGRTHQIRVHMAYIGHPILGDEKYGTKGKLFRPALHAKTLGFTHPATSKHMEFTSELPDDMKELISRGHL